MSMTSETFTSDDALLTRISVPVDLDGRTGGEVVREIGRALGELHQRGIQSSNITFVVDGEASWAVSFALVGIRPATYDEVAAYRTRQAQNTARRAAQLRAELVEIEKLENGS